jgi:hypothetical protein
MRVQETADGTVVVSHDGARFAAWLLAIGGLVGAGAIVEAVAASGERVIGLVGGACTLLLIGVVMFERSRFAFDPKTKSVQWFRRWAWWTGEGSIPFAQVAEIVVHSPLGDDGTPSRRIVLRVDGRREIPLTASFQTDADDAVLRLGQKLRAMVGRPSPSRRAE